jgi:hypothetical protein
MKKYNVTIPIAGFVYVEVEVPEDATEDDIYEAACATYNDDEKAGIGVLEWEFHQQITSGNVLHASVNEWYYEEET